MALRKRAAALTMSLILLAEGTTVLAEPLSEQLQRQKNQLEESKNLYDKVAEEKENIEIKIQNFDVQIEELMDKIEENKNKILKTEEEIKSIQLEVEETEQKVEEERDLMDNRLRSVYKSGSNQYLSILLGSKNFGDFITRVESIKRIAEYDKKLIDSFQEKVDKLNDVEKNLSDTKAELVALKEADGNRLATIKNSMSEQKKLIEELNEKEKLYASRVTEAQRTVDSTIAKIQQIRKATPKYVPSRGAAPISDNAIIAYASNFLGTPYLWGGTRPDTGFDCSGFTQYVFAHFGVRLGRTTRDQIHDGYAVSKSELQVGDLVFFGSNGVPNHMGIYAGDNTYIHSPQTGDVVKISAMTRRDFITGRRVK